MKKIEPVAWQHMKPTVNDRGEIVGYSTWKDGHAALWPCRALYTDDALQAVAEAVRDKVIAIIVESKILSEDGSVILSAKQADLSAIINQLKGE